MTGRDWDDAWYGDALPDGEHVVLRQSKPWLETHLGTVPLFEGDKILMIDATTVNGFKFAGQSHRLGLGTLQWDGQWKQVGSSFGVLPQVYLPNGFLLIATASHQGYRYVDDFGQPHTGDETYTDPVHKLNEWTEHGHWRVGFSGLSLQIVNTVTKKRYFLDKGHALGANATKFKAVGNRFAVYWHNQQAVSSHARWFDASEIPTIFAEASGPFEPNQPPIVVPPVDPPTQPHPEPPMSDIPNCFNIVERVRGQYLTPLGAEHPRFLLHVASEIERAGFGVNAGLLRKHGGTVIRLPDGTTVSQDFLTWRTSNGEVWGRDILADGEGSANPTWGAPEQFDPARFYDVVPFDPPTQPPQNPDPPQPQPPTSPPFDVEALKRELRAEFDQKLSTLERDLQHEIDKLEEAQIPTDVVRVSTHKVTTTVNLLGRRDFDGKFVRKTAADLAAERK